jgi:hypothetical protein
VTTETTVTVTDRGVQRHVTPVVIRTKESERHDGPTSEPVGSNTAPNRRRLLTYGGIGGLLLLFICAAGAYYWWPLTEAAQPAPPPIVVASPPLAPTPVVAPRPKLLAAVDCAAIQKALGDQTGPDQQFVGLSNAIRITEAYLSLRKGDETFAITVISEARCYGPTAVANVIRTLQSDGSADDPNRGTIIQELGDTK